MLTDQLRRAAVSGVLNIAEGYGRYHYLDCLRFYHRARGSLTETLSALIVCDELQYTSGEIHRQRELCASALRSLMATSGSSAASSRARQNTGSGQFARKHLPIQDPTLLKDD